MTTTAPETDTDLDLLDDPFNHALCRHCTTTPPHLPFIALCGRRAIGLQGKRAPLWEVPPDVQVCPCPECLELLKTTAPCRLCGLR